LQDSGPKEHPFGVGSDPGKDCDGVGAVGFGYPHRPIAEAFDLTNEVGGPGGPNSPITEVEIEIQNGSFSSGSPG
jgi:hypothetical protein